MVLKAIPSSRESLGAKNGGRISNLVQTGPFIALGSLIVFRCQSGSIMVNDSVKSLLDVEKVMLISTFGRIEAQ